MWKSPPDTFCRPLPNPPLLSDRERKDFYPRPDLSRSVAHQMDGGEPGPRRCLEILGHFERTILREQGENK